MSYQRGSGFFIDPRPLTHEDYSTIHLFFSTPCNVVIFFLNTIVVILPFFLFSFLSFFLFFYPHTNITRHVDSFVVYISNGENIRYGEKLCTVRDTVSFFSSWSRSILHWSVTGVSRFFFSCCLQRVTLR